MSLLKRKNDGRARLLRNVSEESFAVDEARLYLDTHPNDKKAQLYFDRHNEARRRAIAEYEALYGPLVSDSIEASKTGWTWTEPPMPWEGDDN